MFKNFFKVALLCFVLSAGDICACNYASYTGIWLRNEMPCSHTYSRPEMVNHYITFDFDSNCGSTMVTVENGKHLKIKVDGFVYLDSRLFKSYSGVDEDSNEPVELVISQDEMYILYSDRSFYYNIEKR